MVDIKKCGKCQVEYSTSNFYKHAGRYDGLNQSCKTCHNVAMVQRAKKKRKERHKLLAELKNVPCAACGMQYPAYAMQFHHVDPSTKSNDVSQMLAGGLSILLEEVAKCVVVCANCHLGIERGFINFEETDGE